MLKNDAPRPTFLIPRVVQSTGGARPADTFFELPGLFEAVIVDSQAAEAWWTIFEPLIVALTLAGYDTPEIVVARWDVPDQYLRLLAWLGVEPGSSAHVILEQGDWRAATGAEVAVPDGDLDGKVVAALRVEARRWPGKPIGLPSPYPALPLVSVVSGYVSDAQTPAAEPADPFADPADGWIVFQEPHVLKPDHTGTLGNVRAARDQVAAALASAWRASAGPVGLVPCLDPATWDSPLQHVFPLDAFNALAVELWTRLKTGGNLAALLALEPDDPAASALRLLAAARGVDPVWLTATGVFGPARNALQQRHASLFPRESTGPMLIASFEKAHWAILLFALHEYGLIRLLPFAVTDPTILPPAGVVRDLPPVDVTGLYETAPGDSLLATVQLNQAGDRLDGWITDRQLFRYEFTAALDPTTYRPSENIVGAQLDFNGGLDGDDDRFVQVHGVPHPDDGLVALQLGVGYDPGTGVIRELDLARRDRRSRLRPSLLAEALPSDVVAALERSEDDGEDEEEAPEWTTARARLEAQATPLHSLHADGFRLARTALFEDLETMHDPPDPDSTLSLDDTADRMLGILVAHGVLDDADVPEVPSPLLLRFRREVKMALFSQVLSVGVTYWAWLNELLVTRQADSETLARLLDLEPGLLDQANPLSDTSEHRYTFTITGGGIGAEGEHIVDIEGGGWLISVPIQHLEECRPEGAPRPHGWPDEEQYYGVMLEGAAGPALGKKVALNFGTAGDPNTLITRGEWSRLDFSPAAIVSGSLSLTGGGYIGVGGGGAVPTTGTKFPLEGTQGELIMIVSWRGEAVSEISPNSGWAVKTGIGAGADVALTAGFTLGYILGMGDNTAELPVTVRTVETTFGENSGVVLGAFAPNDWRLTPGMVALLARNVARYRPLLESPAGIAHVEADASSTGPEGANELLTWKRALAAYAWMRALLTTAKQPLDPTDPAWRRRLGTSSALALSADRITLTGNGELEARTVGRLDDDVEVDEWRRVKVQINDQVLVIL